MTGEDLVQIEIDGQPVHAPRGAMLIEVTDRENVRVPRFCYHRKLSVAANCRMCLVEVEKAPKPLPACATPVTEGMKVHTRSAKALAAQRATMEFLLINHPLDCPICDQGGECELQDVAMGYGGDVSRYTEAKRVVRDKDIGPLVATDMTRCIHCTRCVRFGAEIAGVRELGATGRGEFMEIGTYVEHAMTSEISGNVIDLCPVGALTAKPSRMQARAWEMVQHPGVAVHDLLGSNTYLHILRGRVVRVIPRDNEAINEAWLSDRDRFSYEGLYAADRVTQPQIRRDGEWHDATWDEALERVAERLRATPPEDMGGLASANASVEELYLFQKLLRGLGVRNLDHRLRQSDFSVPMHDPLFPWTGRPLASLTTLESALLIGADVRRDQPLLGVRLRHAAVRGAGLAVLGPSDPGFEWPGLDVLLRSPSRMPQALAAMVAAAASDGRAVPPAVAPLVAGLDPGPEEQAVAAGLSGAAEAAILLGPLAMSHPQFAQLRALAAALAELTGTTFGYLPEGGNSAGAWLTGCVPHRGPGGAAEPTPGSDASAMIAEPLRGYVTLGIEPEFDCADPSRALAAMKQADWVVALTPYASETLRDYADVILPVAGFAETSGTYVNGAGSWQTVSGVCAPTGESRPAWKVLRVLGNRMGLAGFEQLSSREVRDEFRECLDPGPVLDNGVDLSQGVDLGSLPAAEGLERASVPMIYRTDAVVRRSPSLQQTPAARQTAARVHPEDAAALGLSHGDDVVVSQGNQTARFELALDAGVAIGTLWVPGATEAAAGLGAAFGPVDLSRGVGGHD